MPNTIFNPAAVATMSSLAINIFKNSPPDIKYTSGPQYIDNRFLNVGKVSDYSVDISKTILHEFSHASMFKKVGGNYWLKVGAQEESTEDGGNYGFGNLTSSTATWMGPTSNLPNANNIGWPSKLDDFIELTEAWAEFLGENYTMRIYTFGNPACRMHNPLGGGPNGASNISKCKIGATPYTHTTLASKQESGHAWADIWIPTGMFNDLMDNTNTDPSETNWDKYGGYTIAEMFNAFDISRPAHEDYLTYIAPLHGYTYANSANNVMFQVFENNKGL
jgi:hypothetical protein